MTFENHPVELANAKFIICPEGVFNVKLLLAGALTLFDFKTPLLIFIPVLSIAA